MRPSVDTAFDGALTPGVREKRVLDRNTGLVRFVKTQTISDKFFDAIRARREMIHPKSTMRYRGSIPMLTAQAWAKECGAAIGTRAFNEYAHAKLLTGGEYAKLRGD